MTIDFKRNNHVFAPVTVNGKGLSVVNSVKIIGLTLSNDLSWNNHIDECIKKANKRLYFLVLLKRARVNCNDIINLYCSMVRPILEYCDTIFHYSLPDYLSDDLERVQKRALSIIAGPELSYRESLSKFNLSSLRQRRGDHCYKLFNDITVDKHHKLHHLLPPKHRGHYNTRRKRIFDLPRFKTNRFKRSFISAMCGKANQDG